MFLRKRYKVSPVQELENARADAQQNNAEKELAEALSIAQQLKEIRERNHFADGFRRAIGGTLNGH